MSTHKNWQVLAAALGLALAGTAPAAADVAAVLARRARLAADSPPAASSAVLKGGAVELTRLVVEYVPVAQRFTYNVVEMVPRTEEYEVKVGDRIERRTRTAYVAVTRQQESTRTVMQTVLRSVRQVVAVSAVKAFAVTRQGKLEPLDGGRLADRLKKPTAVLLGDRAEVDPRHLELIRPGTVYLVLPPAGGAAAPRPGPEPGEKIPLPKGALKDDPTRNRPATLAVSVPADAALWVDDHRTSQTGARRTFTTPRLSGGEGYLYELRASWVRDGQTVTQTRQVMVHAGKTTNVTFTGPQP